MFDEPVFRVFLYALITAVATGFGALPFFFVRDMPRRWLGWSGAVASGIMLAASFRLIEEGIVYDLYRTVAGVGVGLLFILVSQRVHAGRGAVDIIAGEGFRIRMTTCTGASCAARAPSKPC